MSKDKKIKQYDKMLKKFQKQKSIVNIYRNVTEGEANIQCIIQNMTKEFMHLAECDDFKFVSEVIIRMDHYDGIGSNAYDETTKKILEAEKELSDKKPQKAKIEISTWQSIFSDLKKQDIHVIVECEDLKNPTFTIGPIEKVNKKSVEIRYYDASGKYDKKPTEVKFKNITLVKFNDNYSKTFRKYLK